MSITSDTTYKFSEIFHSFQGEGMKTGTSCAWIRFFLCNLNCNGFGQEDPTDPSTYHLPFEDFDVSSVKRIEDLPVWEYGCDSSYTWAKKFRHLAHDRTAADICSQLQESLAHPSNPSGLFRHPATGQDHHMCFTGGEPMLPVNQRAVVAILKEFALRDNTPRNVTVETNGTKKLSDDFSTYIRHEYRNLHTRPEWFWSCSPKLFSTSGELAKRAIKPAVIGQYADIGDGQLKYVVNGTQQSWEEVEQATERFRKEGCSWPVYIMAVGATKEEQEEQIISEIAMEALKRGYHFSGRLHCYVFGNAIGT